MRAHSTSASLLLLGCLLGAAPIGVAAADTPPPSIRRATTSVAREMAAQPELSERGVTAPSASAQQQQQQQKPRRRSKARVISGAVIGGTVGFFVGGYIGGLIEPGFLPADGDLAALRGIIIGATSGAVLGAILGGKFF